MDPVSRCKTVPAENDDVRSNIKWSSPVDMKEFVRRYSDRLPMIVMITSGYYGDSEFDTFGSDQMMRVECMFTQKRVIGRLLNTVNQSEKTCLLSFPVDHKLPFDVLNEDDGQSWKISDIILHKVLPVKVAFDKKHKTMFHAKSVPQNNVFSRKIELQETYEEYYFKVNTINAEALNQKVLCLPAYIRIHLAEGLGFVNRPDDDWTALAEYYNQAAKYCNFDEVHGNKDIAYYKSMPSCESDYGYIEPSDYVIIKRFGKEKSNKGDEEGTEDSYEKPNSSKYDSPEGLAKVTAKKQTLGKQPKTAGMGLLAELNTKFKNVVAHIGPKYAPVVPDRKITHTEKTVNKLQQRPLPLPKPGRLVGKGLRRSISESAANPPRLKARESYFDDGDTYDMLDDQTTERDEITCNLKDVTTEASRPTIEHVSDIPDDLTTLAVGDVVQCLKLINLGQYSDKFVQEQVDGDLLVDMDEDMLKQDFGFSGFQAQKVVKFARRGWRPK